MLNTFTSILFQLILAYGANALSVNVGLTKGNEVFTIYWVFTSFRYLYNINKYLEVLKVAQEELTLKMLNDIKLNKETKNEERLS